MNLKNVTLISFGNFDKDFLNQIAESVRNEFHISVFVNDIYLDLNEFYDPSRRQYNGNKLLQKVHLMAKSDEEKIVGLFNVDLFIPILTYIFGQAILNGSTGIASMYRLSNERYGLKSNQKLLLERFKKEVIHELGHMFGLIHCVNPQCVMRSSTYVEDIDQKSTGLCIKCKKEIGLLL